MGDDDRQIKYIKVDSTLLEDAIGKTQFLVDSPCALQPFAGRDGLHPGGDQPNPGKP